MTDFAAPLAYRAASLETAACLWEAVLEMESTADVRDGRPIGFPEAGRARDIKATREAIGTSALRRIVIGWTDAADAAWRIADTDNGRSPAGGEYGEAFDWEFIPAWIVQNVDWSEPTWGPSLRPASPVCADVDITAERLSLAGFAVEGGGAGAAFMSRTVQHPGSDSRAAIIIATDREGADLPRADSWRLGVYPADAWEMGAEPLATLESVPGAVIEASANAAAVMARGLVFGGRA